MADVDQEYVDSGLRRANHVFCWGDKLDDRLVKLCASPSVTRDIADGIPIEKLRNLVRHGTHAASPAGVGRQ
jgi:hypothetical protein